MAIMRVAKIDDRVAVRNVLLSVYDKSNLDFLVPELLKLDKSVRLYSTGGTYEHIASLPNMDRDRLVQVSEYTGQPEMSGGLVKTLDFKIYLGLLSETYNQNHRADLDRTGAMTIDMVVVNLYPFDETIARKGIDIEDARGNIDIGGPCMLRAAAKNYLRVAAICDPTDYSSIVDELKANDGATALATRFTLARKTFKHTATYDTAISAYLETVQPDATITPYKTE